MEHEFGCNCEDCWWANGCREVCGTCGAFVGEGCGHDDTTTTTTIDSDD